MEFWKKHPVIYEINTWVWLQELSQQADRPVNLGTVPDKTWDDLASLQVDAVWFMGVWERSPRGIAISNQNAGNLSDFRNALPDFSFADNTGSPYCVRNYIVDSHLGGNNGLAEARRKLAARGIKIILDFVPNHLAHDHPWIKERPDHFIQGNKEDLRDDPANYVQIGPVIFACGKDPFYPAWQDVIQVNAFEPGLRADILETLKGIATICDGVRCDMAMLLITDIFAATWGRRAGTPPETGYWEYLIPAVKRQNRDFIFIAEAYWDTEWQLQRMGFDYCYDKRLYDRMEKNNADDIRLHLRADTAYQSKLVRFLENHDEPRHVSIFSPGQLETAAILAYTLPGARLFHEGQFQGRKIKLPVFLQRRPEEPPDNNLELFYHRLLHLLKHQVFHRGYWQMCECTGWPDNPSWQNLMAWCWCDGDNRFVVVVNWSDRAAQGRVRLPGHDLRGRNWRLNDPFEEVTYERNGDEMHNEGLFVSLQPWKNHLFRFHMV